MKPLFWQLIIGMFLTGQFVSYSAIRLIRPNSVRTPTVCVYQRYFRVCTADCVRWGHPANPNWMMLNSILNLGSPNLWVKENIHSMNSLESSPFVRKIFLYSCTYVIISITQFMSAIELWPPIERKHEWNTNHTYNCIFNNFPTNHTKLIHITTPYHIRHSTYLLPTLRIKIFPKNNNGCLK